MAADTTHRKTSSKASGSDALSEPLSALQTEVMSAVRGAITTVMAGQGNGIDLDGIDLDFSPTARPARLPILLAKPEQALALPAPTPVARSASASRIAMAAAVTIGVGGAAAAAWFQGVPGAAHLANPQPAAVVVIPAKPATLKPIASLAPIIAPEPPPEPQSKPAPLVAAVPVPPVVHLVDLAQRARSMLDSGQVRDARALLLAAPDTDRSDVALVLAHSYDGNYLQTLGRPDATGDSGEARRWYQRWFDLASKDGSVPKTLHLDRLLLSLPTEPTH